MPNLMLKDIAQDINTIKENVVKMLAKRF